MAAESNCRLRLWDAARLKFALAVLDDEWRSPSSDEITRRARLERGLREMGQWFVEREALSIREKEDIIDDVAAIAPARGASQMLHVEMLARERKVPDVSRDVRYLRACLGPDGDAQYRRAERQAELDMRNAAVQAVHDESEARVLARKIARAEFSFVRLR